MKFTEYRGVNITTPYSALSTNSGEITTFYGLYMQDFGASPVNKIAITNRYGIYIDDAVADNYFAGTLHMGGLVFPQQAPTASAPTYVKGGIYFDTTLNKLRVGGASGWETVTSS
jgi:hypothetical protein